VAEAAAVEESGLPRASRAQFRPLTFRREGPEYVVGCREISVYLSVPAVGVDVIQMLDAGATIEEVEQKFASHPPDERPDVRDFVSTLADAGLVSEVDGRPLEYEAPEPEEGTGVSMLRGLRGERVRWLFSRPALVLHAAAFVAVLVLLALHPGYFPLSRDFFVLPWLSLNTALVAVTSVAFLLVHEMAHVAAARAMGVDGRINVGRRLWVPVAQTNLGEIWELSRGSRIVVYLAGIIVNTWIFLACLVIAMQLGPSPLRGWLRLVMIFEFYGIASQLVLFVKTDLHYVLADLFYARNLMEQSREYLEGVASKVIPGLCPPPDLSALPELERRFIKVYAWASVAGLLLAVALFLGYALPFAVRSIDSSVVTLFTSHSLDRTVDSVLTLILFGANLGLVGYVLWRDQLRRLLFPRRAPEPTVAMPPA
jgi:putative peptide zinc metalloprotease protein